MLPMFHLIAAHVTAYNCATCKPPQSETIFFFSSTFQGPTRIPQLRYVKLPPPFSLKRACLAGVLLAVATGSLASQVPHPGIPNMSHTSPNMVCYEGPNVSRSSSIQCMYSTYSPGENPFPYLVMPCVPVAGDRGDAKSARSHSSYIATASQQSQSLHLYPINLRPYLKIAICHQITDEEPDTPATLSGNDVNRHMLKVRLRFLTLPSGANVTNIRWNPRNGLGETEPKRRK